MRSVLASPLGFLVGLAVGALGGGGSVLAVPVLVYVAGQSPHAATTTSLVVVGLSALVGAAGHQRAGRVRIGVGVAFGAVGAGGSLAGSALNRTVEPDLLLLAFAGLLVVAAWRMLLECPSCTREGEQRAVGSNPGGSSGPGRALLAGGPVDTAALVEIAAAGTAVGFLTGLFGVGGGFVIVPALTLLFGFAMPEAIGTSLVVVAITTVVALVARSGTAAAFDWGVIVPFAVASLAGVVTGTSVTGRIPSVVLLRWFAALLVLVAAYVALRSVAGLT